MTNSSEITLKNQEKLSKGSGPLIGSFFSLCCSYLSLQPLMPPPSYVTDEQTTIKAAIVVATHYYCLRSDSFAY